MKSYTDIEQSKKLAEFLPLESADMCFNISQRHNMPPLMTPYSKFNEFFDISPTPDFLIPCWSLAALLDILPTGKVLLHDKGNHGYKCICNNIDSYYFNNPVDACYEMILKLHEQKIL